MRPSSSIGTEEAISLLSVGIDIGSATSQVVFSRLRLEKVGSRYVTVERKMAYQSDVALTPYLHDSTIDGDALGRIIARAYEAGGIARTEVDTGALIVTGVALERHNSRVIGDLFADEAGKFVTVSAGDHLEAVMAAFGSGAVETSRERSCAVLNIDIGGGTTKLAVCRRGTVECVAAVDVGARLIVVDDDNVVVGIEPAGYAAIARTGVDVRVGRAITPVQVDTLAVDLVDCILAATPFTADGTSPALRTTPLTTAATPESVTFSGGVAEYVYGREARQFGDLGTAIGRVLRDRIRELEIPVLPLTSGIRATVLGVSQYAVQVSGSTISMSSDDVLPLRNVPVAGPALKVEADIDAADIAAGVRARLRVLDAGHGLSAVAMPVAWTGSVTYERLDALARGVIAGFDPVIENDKPVVLVFDEDVGQLFGKHLEVEMHVAHTFICIDCVELREFDFIDIGEPLPGAAAVPVVIKSLVFGQA